jgi:hypothetical protein
MGNNLNKATSTHDIRISLSSYALSILISANTNVLSSPVPSYWSIFGFPAKVNKENGRFETTSHCKIKESNGYETLDSLQARPGQAVGHSSIFCLSDQTEKNALLHRNSASKCFRLM